MNINAKQVQARDPAHMSRALLFDASGNPTPDLITEPYLAQAVIDKLNKTDDFSKEIISWDPDLGGAPIQVSVPPFVADSFSFALDLAVYSDVFLGPLYDETRPLIFKYMFQMPGPGLDEVRVELGYQFIGGAVAPGLNYTVIQDYFTPDGTNTIRTREISIPAQSGLGTNPVLSLIFTRLGVSDASSEDLNLINTQVYQS